VNAYEGRVCHLQAGSGRLGKDAVAAMWLMDLAVLQSLYGRDKSGLARRWKSVARRFLVIELFKDVIKRRWNLPTARGILAGLRMLDPIYHMDPARLLEWYLPWQERIVRLGPRRAVAEFMQRKTSDLVWP
jgi:hypothetical protein